MKVAVVIAFMVMTLIFLTLGIVSMIKGGEFNEKHGNKLMRFRVMSQAVAVILLVLLFSAE